MKVGSKVLCPERRAAGPRAAATRCRYELGEPKGKKMGSLLTIPAEYSEHLTFFITMFLPEGWTGPVWLQKNGRPRVQFTAMTRLVTESSIRRRIAALHFRHSMVTASSETDAVALAAVQGTSVATQSRACRAR
jgi:hypothetical protein